MLSRTRWTIGAVTAVALVVGVSTAALSNSGTPPPNPAPDAVPMDVVQAVDAPSAGQDLFTPITPCRVLDTRESTPITAGASRAFYVTGTTGFAPQGGKTGGCGIPASATAIAATVLSVGSTSTGRLTAYPNGDPVPTATTLYFSAGETTSTGTIATLKAGNAKPLAIRAYAQTDVVLDVTGYYTRPVAGTFNDSGGLYAGPGTLMPYAHPATGYYTLKANRDVTGCSVQTTSYYYPYNVSAYTSGTFVFVLMSNDEGDPIDYYFHAVVTC